MKIAVVASEAAPFVKTGGLGDVMQALPLALSKQKNTYVSLFLPYYSQIKYSEKWPWSSWARSMCRWPGGASMSAFSA